MNRIEFIHKAHMGIIGKVYHPENGQSPQPMVAKRTTYDYSQYVKELVTRWKYDEESALALDRAAMSWMAIPLVREDGKTVEGILYCDSTIPDFFGEAQRKLAGAACVGIAGFIRDRYK